MASAITTLPGATAYKSVAPRGIFPVPLPLPGAILKSTTDPVSSDWPTLQEQLIFEIVKARTNYGSAKQP